MHKSAESKRTAPLSSTAIKKDTGDPHYQVAYGLVQVLNKWVKEQRRLREAMAPELFHTQSAFDYSVKRKMGCDLPPASSLLPTVNIPQIEYISDNLDDDQTDNIKAAADILACSCYPWSAQTTSAIAQHHSGIASGILALIYDAGIYSEYLGEDTIWHLYSDILELICQFNVEFIPWHNITTDEDRAQNTQTTSSH